MKFLFAILLLAFVGAVFAQCTATVCGECIGTAGTSGCGWCIYEGNGAVHGQCGAFVTDSQAPNISVVCNEHQGTVHEACPVVDPCSGLTCAPCRETAGCGVCWGQGADGLWSFCKGTAGLAAACEAEHGHIVQTTCSEIVATPPPAPVLPICTSKDCGECQADDRCAFCSGSDGDFVFGTCRQKVTDNAGTAEGFCAEHHGVLIALGQCVVPEPPANPPPGPDNTDITCPTFESCIGCFEHECGLCRLANGGIVCRSNTLLREGKTGPAYCEGVQGHYDTARVHEGIDVCTGANAGLAVNNGQLTESAVNSEFAGDDRLPGVVVIVTVITQAENNADGSSHFRTFFEVTGTTAPTPAQLEVIRSLLKTIIATHLGINPEAILVEIHISVKRVTSSYVADVTVGGANGIQNQGGSATVAASLGLLASAAALAMY